MCILQALGHEGEARHESAEGPEQMGTYSPERVRSVPYDAPGTWSQYAIRDARAQLVGDVGVHFGPEGSRDVEIGVTVAFLVVIALETLDRTPIAPLEVKA